MEGRAIVPAADVGGHDGGPGDDVSNGHFVEQLAGVGRAEAFGVEGEEEVGNVEVGSVEAQFDGWGVEAEALAEGF